MNIDVISNMISVGSGDKDFVDVTLGTEGKKLPAHKMLLSACSPYFRELLKVFLSSSTQIQYSLLRCS
jgi:hypothetical protein